MRSVLLFVLLGCGPKSSPPTPQPPPPPDAAVDAAVTTEPVGAGSTPTGPLNRDLPRLALRSVGLYEAVVAAFKGAGADCAAATAKLGVLRTEYADVTAANAKVLHEGRARELKAALVKHDDKLDAAAKAIVSSQTLAKCTQDKAFTKAFDDLVGAPP